MSKNEHELFADEIDFYKDLLTKVSAHITETRVQFADLLSK